MKRRRLQFSLGEPRPSHELLGFNGRGTVSGSVCKTKLGEVTDNFKKSR